MLSSATCGQARGAGAGVRPSPAAGWRQRRTASSGAGSAARRGRLGLAGGAAVILGGAIAARVAYGYLGSGPAAAHPLRDTSRATVTLGTPPAPPSALTRQRLVGGGAQIQQLQEADAVGFEAFAAQQRAALDAARRRTRSAAAEALRAELCAALDGPRGRVAAFADWYFAYRTTYTLLGVAMASAAAHAVTLRTEQSLGAAVSAELQVLSGRMHCFGGRLSVSVSACLRLSKTVALWLSGLSFISDMSSSFVSFSVGTALQGGAPCAVQIAGYFRPVSPDGEGDRGNHCGPRHRTSQILTQSKNSDDEPKQSMFHTENARMQSESAAFALWIYAAPGVRGFQGEY